MKTAGRVIQALPRRLKNDHVLYRPYLVGKGVLKEIFIIIFTTLVRYVDLWDIRC